MPFKIVRNDLTKMQVDVIVNTANEEVYPEGYGYDEYDEEEDYDEDEEA